MSSEPEQALSGTATGPELTPTPRSRGQDTGRSISPSASATADSLAWFPSHSGETHYSLRVLQQPVRARMCGFGDRDRRLLTPPVIVELLVRDARTRELIPADDVDVSFFFLNADLWSADRRVECNIVQHPAFAAENARLAAQSFHSVAAPSGLPGGYEAQIYGPPPPPQASSSTARPRLPPISALTSGLPAYPEPWRAEGSSTTASSYPPVAGPSRAPPPVAPPQSPTGGSEVSHTRNLIGAHNQNALKLNGLDGRPTIMFLFHDLSIRTEGRFCLRMNFVSLDDFGRRAERTVPVLTEVFTDPFEVFPAKKFPGMMDPTPLSKHLQNQGVRIPTRTSGRRGGRAEGETGAEGGDEESGDE